MKNPNLEKKNSFIINKYENKDLGVCGSGCRCHSTYILEVDEDDITYDICEDSKPPTHTKLLEDSWVKDNVVEREEKLFWKPSDVIDTFFITHGLEDSNGTQSSNEVCNSYKVDGIWYIEEECGAYDTSLDSLEYEIKKLNLADGEYKILVECGCWTEYHHEYGLEGDGDMSIEVLERIGDIKK